MPRVEIKVTKRPTIEVPGFNEQQMREIGEHAIEVMKERVASVTDVFDEPAKPLQPKYAQRKAKKGLRAVRDIRYTGITQQAIQVTESGSNHVRISIKGNVQYRKALFNQNIDPWFGLSVHDDDRLLTETVQPLFSSNIAAANKL